MAIPKFVIAIIEDLSVVAQKLAPNSVITEKLADLSVTAPKLADLSVTAPKLADGVVTGAKADLSAEWDFVAPNLKVDGVEVIAGPHSGGGGVTAPEAFVFRPGGIVGGNVYTDWATLFTAALAGAGRRIIFTDDSLGAVTIPNGSWDFTDISLVGCRNTNVPSLGLCAITFADAVTITGLTHVKDIRFSSPPGTPATSTLTFTANPSDTQTVTVEGKVYTFQAVLTDVDGNVLRGATASDSLNNLIAAYILGAGAGSLYAASMTENEYVFAAAGAGDTMDVTAEITGTGGGLARRGNSITTSTTVTGASWTGATLSGGTGKAPILYASGGIAALHVESCFFAAVVTGGPPIVRATGAGTIPIFICSGGIFEAGPTEIFDVVNGAGAGFDLTRGSEIRAGTLSGDVDAGWASIEHDSTSEFALPEAGDQPNWWGSDATPSIDLESKAFRVEFDPSGLTVISPASVQVQAAIAELDSAIPTTHVYPSEIRHVRKNADLTALVNITLVGGAPTAADGTGLIDSDIIFCPNQTNKAENGTYKISVLGTGADGTWVRHDDGDAAGDWLPGTEVYIERGATRAKLVYRLTTSIVPITLNTTLLGFKLEHPLVGSTGATFRRATGGTSIEVTPGDRIQGEDAAAGSGLGGGDLVLLPGQGDGAGLHGAFIGGIGASGSGRNAAVFNRGTANGNDSAAFGSSRAEAFNSFSVSYGYAYGDGSFAGGWGTYVTGYYAFAFGGSNDGDGYASGDYAICFGAEGDAAGRHSWIQGSGVNADGDFSSVWGLNSRTTPDADFGRAWGNQARATVRGQFAVSAGKFNDGGEGRSQWSTYHLSAQTTSAVVVIAKAKSDDFIIPQNRSFGFVATVNAYYTVFASQTMTVSGTPDVGDQVELNGTTLTCVDGAAGVLEFSRDTGDVHVIALSIIAGFTASGDIPATVTTPLSFGGGAIVYTAAVSGSGGNAITLSVPTNVGAALAVGGATLLGGVDNANARWQISGLVYRPGTGIAVVVGTSGAGAASAAATHATGGLTDTWTTSVASSGIADGILEFGCAGSAGGEDIDWIITLRTDETAPPIP